MFTKGRPRLYRTLHLPRFCTARRARPLLLGAMCVDMYRCCLWHCGGLTRPTHGGLTRPTHGGLTRPARGEHTLPFQLELCRTALRSCMHMVMMKIQRTWCQFLRYYYKCAGNTVKLGRKKKTVSTHTPHLVDNSF